MNPYPPEVETKSPSLGVAVIGCGYWGMNYVRVFSELPGARLVAVCDARQERLLEVGKRYPKVSLTTDLKDVLSESVDVVVICTSATSHYELARQCMMAGKHVLIEKPIATLVADAEAMISVAQLYGVTLMVGHTFLYNAAVGKIKEYIVRGEIGQVRYLYARRTNLGPIRHDVNALWDLAPHDVSIFNHLLNATPRWVSAVGIRVLGNHRQDAGFISLGYDGGVVGNIHVSWADPNKVRELVVVGSEKRVMFDDVSVSERVKVFEKSVQSEDAEASSFGEHHFRMRDGDIIIPKLEVSEPLKNQCNHFLDSVRQGSLPLSDGQAGLEVVSVMAAIDQSVAQNGAPVLVDYGTRSRATRQTSPLSSVVRNDTASKKVAG